MIEINSISNSISSQNGSSSMGNIRASRSYSKNSKANTDNIDTINEKKTARDEGDYSSLDNYTENEMMSTINLLTAISEIKLCNEDTNGIEIDDNDCKNTVSVIENVTIFDKPLYADSHTSHINENPDIKCISEYIHQSPKIEDFQGFLSNHPTDSLNSSSSASVVLDVLSENLSTSQSSLSTQYWHDYLSKTSPPFFSGSFFTHLRSIEGYQNNESNPNPNIYNNIKSYDNIVDFTLSQSYYNSASSNQYSNQCSTLTNTANSEYSFSDHSILKSFFQTSSTNLESDSFEMTSFKSRSQSSIKLECYTDRQSTEDKEVDTISDPNSITLLNQNTISKEESDNVKKKKYDFSPFMNNSDDQLCENSQFKLNVNRNNFREGPTYWGMWEDERDRMIYVSWLPRAARAISRSDKKQCELVLKHFISNVLCFSGIIKVLLFPPSSAHCKLLFSNEKSAQYFLKAYGGFEQNIGPCLWKSSVCNYFKVKMRKGIYATRVKIIWADQTKNNEEFIKQCDNLPYVEPLSKILKWSPDTYSTLFVSSSCS